MQRSSRALLEEISSHCANQLTLYRFNRRMRLSSDRYRQGRITALEYIGELLFYFMEEEQALQGRFRKEILRQMKQQSWLRDNEYKQGMYDALNDILDQIQQYKDAPVQQSS